MTVYDYMVKKNKIFKDYYHTDINLITPENIVEVKQLPLSTKTGYLICPYCVLYLKNNCENCPSLKFNNKCNEENSTLSKITQFHFGPKLFQAKDSKEFNELQNLVDEYNNDIKLGNTNGIK